MNDITADMWGRKVYRLPLIGKPTLGAEFAPEGLGAT